MTNKLIQTTAKISGVRALRADLDKACAVLSGVLSDIESLGEPPEAPDPIDTGEFDETTVDVIRDWLSRQRILSLISTDGITAVERLIEDVS